MDFFRRFAVGSAIFVCALAISSLMWLVTLQVTLLDRQVVKSWLRDSGVYGQVVPELAKTSQSEAPSSTIVTADTTATALAKTLPPDYVQAQTEQVLDRGYDWLEGKAKTLDFSVPIDEKRTTFTDHLAAAVQPRLASLPPCTTQTADQVALSCLPPRASPEAFAKMVAAEAVTQSGLLGKPLTQESLTAQQQPADRQLLEALPTVVQRVQWLLIALPVVVVLCLRVIAAAAEDKLLAFKRLAGRIFFGAILTLLAAGILLYVSANPTVLPGFAQQSRPIALVTPVLQKVIGGLSTVLAVISGAVVLLSGLSWLSLTLTHRRRQRHSALPKPPQHPDDPQLPPVPPPLNSRQT